MSIHFRKSVRPRAIAGRNAWKGILPLIALGLVGWRVGSPSHRTVGDPPLSIVGTEYRAPQQRETLYAQGPVKVRAGAGQTHAVVRTLSRGDRIQVGATGANGWAPAYDASGARIGYVYRRGTLLRSEPPTSRGGQSGEPQRARGASSGATARCRDGTLSYSAHHRGTCSGHGGVAVWY